MKRVNDVDVFFSFVSGNFLRLRLVHGSASALHTCPIASSGDDGVSLDNRGSPSFVIILFTSFDACLA